MVEVTVVDGNNGGNGNNAAKNNLTEEDKENYRAIFLKGPITHNTFTTIQNAITDDNICKIVKFFYNEKNNFDNEKKNNSQDFYKVHRNRFFCADKETQINKETQIKKNFRILSKKTHPNKKSGKSQNIQDCYTEFIAYVNEFKNANENN